MDYYYRKKCSRRIMEEVEKLYALIDLGFTLSDPRVVMQEQLIESLINKQMAAA